MRVGEDDHLWTSTNDDLRTKIPLLKGVNLDDWIHVKYGRLDRVTKNKILKGCSGKEKAYSEGSRDPGDERSVSGTIEGFSEYNKDVDYLDLQWEKGFHDPDDETYEKRRCELLGVPYEAPPPIVAKKFEITRYCLGPNERFAKIRKLENKNIIRTMTNVAWVRHNLVNEGDISMDGLGQVRRPP